MGIRALPWGPPPKGAKRDNVIHAAKRDKQILAKPQHCSFFNHNACSDDPNTMVSQWGWMARNFFRNRRQLQTFDELGEAIYPFWSKVLVGLLETLASSIPKHIFHAINKNGDCTDSYDCMQAIMTLCAPCVPFF